MSLGDYRSQGKYFTEGRFPVAITAVRRFLFKTGNPGLEVTFSDGNREAKCGLSLLPSALWKLATLAETAGLTPEEVDTYDEKNPASDAALLNRSLIIKIAKKDKYSEVVAWEPIPAEEAAALGSIAPAKQAPKVSFQVAPDPGLQSNDGGDDLPF